MNTSQFLIRPDYNFDESLYGYFQRIMKLNMYHHQWFSKMLGKENLYKFRKFNFFNIDETILKKISFMLDKPFEELKILNYDLEKGRAINLHCESILKMHISTEKMRICPDCLREYGYFRKVWDLYAYTVCHLHKKLLIDTCPTCNKRIILSSSFSYSCNNCGHDLASSTSRPNIDVQLSKLIYEKLHSTNATVEINNPVSQLPLNGLLGVLILVSNSFPEHLDNHISVYRRLSVSDLNICLSRAYSVFEKFPTRYHIFLDEMKLKRRQIAKNLGDGVTRDFGEFSRNIYQYYASAELNFLRAGFEEYLDNNLQEYISSSFKKSDIFEKKYITGFQTLKTLGLKIDVIRELMNKGVLRGYYEPENRLYNTLLFKKDVEEMKVNMIKGALGLAAHIGLDPKDASTLIHKGIFTPVISKKGKLRSTLNIFLKKDVLFIFESIESRMGNQNKVFESELISFEEVLKLIRKANKGLIDLVTLIIGGECIPANKEDEKVGFNKYLFFKHDFEKLIKKDHLKSSYIKREQSSSPKRRHNGYLGDRSYVKNSDDEREYYSVAEAAKKLCLTSYDISHWVRRGFIDAIKVRDNLILIKKDSLDAFYKKYWTISFLKLENKKITNKQFCKHLLKYGFVPISGPNVDGYSRYLFYREGIPEFIAAFEKRMLHQTGT
ncbi:TniQ family protein [Paenibacillus gansuensis]|uniref:TniQ family protein n=1 Tax=Paenibacillus gansuensis TaxID=306542 RepID=A0ABW5PD46_9BACL